MNTPLATKAYRSPKATLKPFPMNSVMLEGFLGHYARNTAAVTIPSQFEIIEESGRLDNFRRVSGKITNPFRGRFYNDSDVYKWFEGAVYASLYQKEAPPYDLRMIAKDIVDAQSSDGYLNTYFSVERENERWTNLPRMHELYCAGHFIQAALACRRVLKEDMLFEAAIRNADHIVDRFLKNGCKGTPGHPEIEMALVELYRETGNSEYLRTALMFLDDRGLGYAGGDVYRIDDKPFRSLTELQGHAVMMLYLLCGATDLCLEGTDETLLPVLEGLWNDMVTSKMYLTGGVGSRHNGEAFGNAFELPNREAYAETCASIANFLWNWRMYLLSGDSKYIDVMERALYNGVLAGISLTGTEYFYVNPLESLGNHKRLPWYECSCCPTNLARFLPSLSGFIYAFSEDNLFVNLYEESSASLSMGERTIRIAQRTRYPFEGTVDIELVTDAPTEFALQLRVPDWSSGFAKLQVDRKRVDCTIKNGYVSLHRTWKGNTTLRLVLDDSPHYVEAHPYVRNNYGKVATQSGPLVYCVEQADNAGNDVWSLEACDYALPVVSAEGTYPDNPKKLRANGYARNYELERSLYRKLPEEGKMSETEFSMIPYYYWANREHGAMSVWIPRSSNPLRTGETDNGQEQENCSKRC